VAGSDEQQLSDKKRTQHFKVDTDWFIQQKSPNTLHSSANTYDIIKKHLNNVHRHMKTLNREPSTYVLCMSATYAPECQNMLFSQMHYALNLST
jgi:hypothetical protein